MLTGTKQSDPLACTACSGTGGIAHVGQYAGNPCKFCYDGTRPCRDCTSPATEIDCHATDLGGACIDCAIRCDYGCGQIATVIVTSTDDQGDAEKLIDCCEECAETETKRCDRIRRRHRYEAACDALGDERRQEVRS